MDLEEVIMILEKKSEREKQHFVLNSSILDKNRQLKLREEISYIKKFIKFLKNEEYNNYVDSINKYYEQDLENRKKNIELSLDKNKIKEKIKEYQKMLLGWKKLDRSSYTLYYQKEINKWEIVLKAIEKNDEKEIENEKSKLFSEEENKTKILKDELLDFLLSEELMKKEKKKLLKEKESNEIKNEDLRKATDLILHCIKEAKEEILAEIKKVKIE